MVKMRGGSQTRRVEGPMWVPWGEKKRGTINHNSGQGGRENHIRVDLEQDSEGWPAQQLRITTS